MVYTRNEGGGCGDVVDLLAAKLAKAKSEKRGIRAERVPTQPLTGPYNPFEG